MAIMYQNSICRMFDQNCIQEQYLQKRHNEQMWKTIECANKLDVFLKCIDGVAPEYQKIAFEQFCMVVGNHMMKKGLF